MRDLIIIRGGGDIATGVAYHLYQCGFCILILECEKPSAIRRRVSFCEAVYTGTASVEGVCCQKADSAEECEEIWSRGAIPLMIDAQGEVIMQMRPFAVVDAIIAKRNLGTNRGMALLTIGLGPGFVAGKDVDVVIETMRGHNLGRIIRQGAALPNTGVPGLIAGEGKNRVVYAPASGLIRNQADIGDVVEKGQVIAVIGDVPVAASLGGVLRGIIRDGYPVREGLKIADIDPRISELENCFSISDKARCIAGSVAEVIFHELWCF